MLDPDELLPGASVLLPVFVVGFVLIVSLLTVPVLDTGDVDTITSVLETWLLDFLVITIFLFPSSSVIISVTETSPSATSRAYTTFTFNFFDALFLYLSWIETFSL